MTNVIDRREFFKISVDLSSAGPNIEHFYGTAFCVACSYRGVYLVPVPRWAAHPASFDCEKCGKPSALFVRDEEIQLGEVKLTRVVEAK